jgi:hypothetical protein
MGLYASLFLISCGTVNTSLYKGSDMAVITSHPNIVTDQSIALDLKKVWPLTESGEYLQQIKINAQDKQYEFFVHLTITKNKLYAIAYNNMFGRLYNLTWTPTVMVWEYNKYIPMRLQPDNIVLDFLLCNLPLDVLQIAINGAKATDLLNVRLIKNNQVVLREIYRQNKIGNLYKETVINNWQAGYSLYINTVVQ